jgi:hypothetical protein
LDQVAKQCNTTLNWEGAVANLELHQQKGGAGRHQEGPRVPYQGARPNVFRSEMSPQGGAFTVPFDRLRLPFCVMPTPAVQQSGWCGRRAGSHSGRKRRALFPDRQPSCTTHRGEVCWRRPPHPLVVVAAPALPVVNRDTRASRVELTTRSPGGTTVFEGARSWGELGCLLPTCPHHVTYCARGRISGNP